MRLARLAGPKELWSISPGLVSFATILPRERSDFTEGREMTIASPIMLIACVALGALTVIAALLRGIDLPPSSLALGFAGLTALALAAGAPQVHVAKRGNVVVMV